MNSIVTIGVVTETKISVIELSNVVVVFLFHCYIICWYITWCNERYSSMQNGDLWCCFNKVGNMEVVIGTSGSVVDGSSDSHV